MADQNSALFRSPGALWQGQRGGSAERGLDKALIFSRSALDDNGGDDEDDEGEEGR